MKQNTNTNTDAYIWKLRYEISGILKKIKERKVINKKHPYFNLINTRQKRIKECLLNKYRRPKNNDI